MRYTIQDIAHPAITELTSFAGYRVQGALDQSGNIRQGVIVSAHALTPDTTIATLETNRGVFAFAFSNLHPVTGAPIAVEVIRAREATKEEFAAHYAPTPAPEPEPEPDPLMFDAAHVDALQAIVKPTDSLITPTQARDLLSAPSGTRPRIYGLMFADGNYQIVALRSVANLDAYPVVAQWLSGTTYADLISRA